MMPFDAASFEDEDSRQYLKSGQRIKAEELATEDGTSIAKCDVLSSKPKTRAEKEIIRKRKYHQRLKNEREALRELESKLSAQLHDLKQQNTISMALVNSNWRDIALNQLLERQRVETEQIKLFAAAKMQALYINNLCGQLPGNATTRLLIQATTARPSNPLFDYTKYSAHVQSVNECYAQVDDVLREFKVSTVQDGVTSSLHYRMNEEEVEYFQHLNKFTEPYNYEQTHQTMWKLAKLQHRQQDRHTFEGLGSPDDTVVIRFRLVRSFTSEMTVSVLQRYVFRRFVETKRTVFVWKTLSEGEGVFAGMQAEETGWVCLEPSTEEDSTLVRICARQAPMRFGVSSFDKRRVVEFQQVLQSSIGEDMLEISTALDRMLLDDTLDGIDI